MLFQFGLILDLDEAEDSNPISEFTTLSLNETDNASLVNRTPKVELISPGDGAKIKKSEILLDWDLIEGDPGEIIYDIYLDRNYPPKLYRSDHASDQFTTSALKPGTYYWRVYPKTSEIRGDCISGYWSFSYQPYDVEVSGPLFVQVPRGENWFLDLSITNRAESFDHVSVQVDTGNIPDSYVDHNWDRQLMASRSTLDLRIQFSIPSNYKTGTDELLVTAISENSGGAESANIEITIDIINRNMMQEDEPDDSSGGLFSADLVFCCVVIFFIVIIVAYAIYNETKRQKKMKKGYPKHQYYYPPKWQYQYQKQGRTWPTPPASQPTRDMYYMDKGEIKEEKDVDLESRVPVEEYEVPEAVPDLFSETTPASPVGAPLEDKQEDSELAEHTKCGRCGLMLPSDAEFCPQCGMKADGAWFKCPVCNSAVYPDETECDNCGAEFKDLDSKQPVVIKPKIKTEEPHKPQLKPVSVEKPERKEQLKFDRTDEIRKKPVEQLTERDINILRVENLEFSDKLYELETDRAMGKMSRDDFLKKRMGLLKKFLKK